MRSRRSYLLATKWRARASSNSGWTGGLDRLRSSGGSTSPLPKSWAQTQLAVARAKYGLSAEVIHRARAFRGIVGRGDRHDLASRQPRRAGCLVRRCMTCPLGLIVTEGRPIIMPRCPSPRAGPWRRRPPDRSNRPGSRHRTDGHGTVRSASSGPEIAGPSARPGRSGLKESRA